MRYITTFIFLLIVHTLFAQQTDTTNKSKFLDTLRMNEAVVSAKVAISIKGDTVNFRVDSFNRDPQATTEDVLKRLPGLEVDKDGNITANGKKITKIFINGKEVQVDDINTITKNLPAYIIDKIQVADHHTDEEVFSGVKKNAEEKMVNIKLKKEYNKGISGRVAAGYGTKDRYQSGLFANIMTKGGTRTTVIGNVNNTGVRNVTDNEKKETSYRTPGVMERQQGTINMALGGNEHWKLNGTYTLSSGSTYLLQEKARTTYLQNDSLLLQDDIQKRTTSYTNQYLYINSRADLNKTTKLNTRLSIGHTINDVQNDIDDLTYNGQRNSDVIDFMRLSTAKNKSNSINGSMNNKLMKRFAKPGNTLIAEANFRYNNSDAEGLRINNNTYYTPFTESTINNRTENINKGYSYRIGLKYSQPVGKKIITSLSYHNTKNYSTADNSVSLLNGSVYEIDTNQTRLFENDNVENIVAFDIRHKQEKLQFGTGVTAVQYNRVSVEELNSNNNVEQTGVNYAPNAFLNYTPAKGKRIQFNYNGNVQAPQIRQLQPIPNYTDSLNIFIGNPDLKPQIRNTIRLRYNANNTKGRNFWSSFYVRWEANKIINNTELTNSKRVTTPVNANGNYQMNANFSMTEPLIKKILKINFAAYSNTSNRVVILNNVLSNLKTYYVNPRLRLIYTSEKAIDASLLCSYTWNEVAAVSGNKNTLHKYYINHEASIKLPYNFRWHYNISYSNNKGINNEFEQEFLLVTTSLDKSFEKLKSLFLRVQVFDVFNDYPVVRRNIGDSYFEDVSVNRIGRYMMFSLIYRFNYYPKSK